MRTAPGIWSDLALAALTSGDLDARRALLPAGACRRIPTIKQLDRRRTTGRRKNQTGKRAIARLNSVAQHSPELLSQAVGQWPPTTSASGPSVVCGSSSEILFVCARREESLRSWSGFQGVAEQLYRSLPRTTMGAINEASGTPTWANRVRGFSAELRLRNLTIASKRSPRWSAVFRNRLRKCMECSLLSWCYSQEAGRTAEKVQQSGGDEAPAALMRGDILLRLQAKAERAIAGVSVSARPRSRTIRLYWRGSRTRNLVRARSMPLDRTPGGAED